MSTGTNTKAEKKLTFRDLLGIGIGTTIGAGVVTVVGQAIGVTGRSAWLAYFVAILWGACNVIPYFFLSSTFVVKGGNYSCVLNLLGTRVAGVYACTSIVSALNFATFCVSTAIYVASVIPGVNQKLVAVAVLIAFYLLNICGLNIFVKVQNVMTICLVGMLLLFGFYGLTRMSPETLAVTSPGFFLKGGEGFLQAITMFLFSTIAYQTLINFSGNAKNPKKDVPKAMFATIGVIIVVYVVVSMAAGGVLPVDEVANQPLTVVANKLWPRPMAVAFVVFGPLMALATTLNGNFAGQGNPQLAAARDGWWPKAMGKTNRFGAPFVVYSVCFVIALVPIVFNYDVSSIIRNMVLIFNMNTLFMAVSALRMPSKYPEAWKKSTFHVPAPVFYVLMAISLCCVLGSSYIQLRNLNAFIIGFTVAAYAVVIGISQYRYAKGYVKIQRTLELDVE